MSLVERNLTNATTVTTTGSSASVSPTGMQEGDWLVIAAIAAGGTGAHTNTAGGLTRAHDDINGGNVAIMSTWVKKCGPSEAGPYTFASGSGSNRRWALSARCYSGGDPTNIVESSPTGVTASATTVDAPGVDPTNTGAIHMIAAAQRTAAGVDATLTEPANYTKHSPELYTGSGGATNSNLVWMTRALPDANATGDKTVTSNTNDRLFAASLLLKAASGAATVDLTPATFTLTPEPVDPDPQPVTANLTASTLTLTAISLNAVPQPVTVSLTQATMTLSAVSVTPVAQPVTVNLTAATLTLQGVSVTPTPQPVTVNLSFASITLEAQPVTPFLPQGSVDLTPSTFTLSGVAVTPVPQPITVNITPGQLTISGNSVTPVPQPVTISLSPAVFTVSAEPLSAQPGPVTVNLTSAIMTLEAVRFTTLGEVALQPAILTLEAQPLTATPGPVSVNLVPATLAIQAPPVVGTPGPVTVNLVASQVTLAAGVLSALGVSTVNLTPAQLLLSAGSVQPGSGEPLPADVTAYLDAVQNIVADLAPITVVVEIR